MKLEDGQKGFLVILSFIGLIFFNELRLNLNDNKLRKEGNITEGRIILIEKSYGKMVRNSMYQFTIDNKNYEGEFKQSTFCEFPTKKERKKLINAKVWIIYDPEKPSLSKIITSESELKKYSEIVKKSPKTSKLFFKYIRCE
ncbi:MAG: hypothetical protein ACJAUH_000047 [Saprospiraceae bacterium]|jgi:hypothetical protein